MNNESTFLSGAENLSIPAATVIPVLHYPDVAAAAAWLTRAYGFAERLRIGDHRIQMSVGGGAVVVARGAAPAADATRPSFSIMVRVTDADEHARRAAAAGADLLSQPQSFPYGERQYSATDLAGYVWTFSQSVGNVHPGEWGGALVG